MKHNWSIIKKGTGRGSKPPAGDDTLCVFVDKRADMRLSTLAYRALNAPRYVLIYSDGNGLVGVASSPQTNETYKVGYGDQSSKSSNHSSDTRRIACKKVCKEHFQIPSDGWFRYPGKMEDGILVIDTTQPPLV
jgi:hypothetical protein